MHATEIDFVILWVDDGDPVWREAFAAAKKEAGHDADASLIRYRDWQTLRYWFRAVERFAPWVHAVHLVTWGHLPAWLDTAHPKLRIVRHEEFLPAEFRPTFNSNAIELCLDRIEGLAEHFVLFNDDMFLTRACRPDDFFSPDGRPRDIARLSIVQPSSIGHIIYNNMELINAAYRKRDAVRRNIAKWFSPRYGVANLLKTATLMPWDTFAGFTDTHMPTPHRRSDFARARERWGDRMDATCRHRFRELTDLSHWLIRYARIAEGDFAPRGMGDCSLMTLKDSSIEDICRDIEQQRRRMICINDSTEISDFEALRDRLNCAFRRLLPQQSAYEKY